MKQPTALENCLCVHPYSIYFSILKILLILFIMIGAPYFLYPNLSTANEAWNDVISTRVSKPNQSTKVTINSGLWSDHLIWSDGEVPTDFDDVIIMHNVSASGSLEYNSLSIQEGVFLNIAGTTTFANDIVNHGIFRWTNGGLDGGANNATLINHGTLEMNTTFNPALDVAEEIVDLNFLNTGSGMVIKGGSNGFQNIFGHFTNEGTVITSPSKGITFFGPITNSGAFNLQSSGGIQFNNTVITLNGGSFSGDGRIELVGENTISGAFNPAVALVIQAGNALVTGSAASIHISSATTYNLNIGSKIIGFEAVVNDGTLNVLNNSTFENDIHNNGIINWTNGGIFSSANSTITNTGTFNIDTYYKFFEVDLVNQNGGEIVVDGDANTTQTISTSLINETGGNLIVNQGGLILSGDAINNGTVYNNDFLLITGNMSGGGQFFGIIQMSTSSTLDPGNPNIGCFTFGDATGELSISGLFRAEINGTTSCIEHDQITHSGSLVLGGSLEVVINYPDPQNLDKITLIDAVSLSGSFNSVSTLPQFWTLKYNYPREGQVTLEYEVPDSDGDGIPNDLDNCPDVANELQRDNDLDGQGDVCDEDDDNDGVLDEQDNCSVISNSDQSDLDNDGIGDVCDICPLDADNDIDGDGICGDIDNCPSVANGLQQDADCDGVGDLCDVCPGGDDSIDNNKDGIPDCSQILPLDEYSDDWKCGNNGTKLILCHKPPGNPDKTQSLCVSVGSLESHLYNHGDFIGPCVECSYEDEAVLDYDAEDPSGFLLYPNPASTHYNVDITDLVFANARINVYDIQMSLVNVIQLTESDRNTVMNFLIQDMPTGIYFVVITADSETYVQRLVVE